MSDTPTVALFATCFNDTMWPDAPRATVTLLERLGCRVVFPREQTCCGQMFTNTGYADEGTALVRRFAQVFDPSSMSSPSGSCVGSVREQHAALARRAGDAGLERAAEDVAGRTYEALRVPRRRAGRDGRRRALPAPRHLPPDLPLAADAPRRRQAAAPAAGGARIDLVGSPAAEECCGFGGTFAMKNADVSIAMGSDKARHVRETGAEVLVAGDRSCLAHIGGILGRQRAGVRTMHLAEVLASTEEDPA